MLDYNWHCCYYHGIRNLLWKIQAEEIRLIRENGTASSGRIEDGTEEQYAKLKQLDYVKQVGKSIFVGEATEVSENNAKRYVI